MPNEDHTNIPERYAIWSKPNTDSPSIGKELDSLLKGFFYYPEEEWNKFDIRPPESSDLLGAWRDNKGDIFIFLLKNYHDKKSIESSDLGPDYEVIVWGKGKVVSEVGKLIGSLKDLLYKIEKKEIAEKKAARNFESEIKSKSSKHLIGTVAIFTVIVNALSLYLRKLPSPELENEWFSAAYSWTLGILHIGALLLLLLIVVISFLYLMKFGVMLIRGKR